MAIALKVRKAVRRGTLAGLRPGRGREMGGAGDGSLWWEDSDTEEGVGEGCSVAGMPWMDIAIAGVMAVDQTPAKDRTGWFCGVAEFGGRLRNQTGSSGGSSVADWLSVLSSGD
jgi:hypothetical protein